MKRTFILIIIVFNSINSFSQISNEFLVGLAGIGSIKLGMTVAELERTTGQKIKTSLSKENKEYMMDTIRLNFKGAEFQITLYNEYLDQDKYQVAIYSITCSSPLCKTRSGIVIGDDKMKIVSIYDTYYMEIAPFTEEVGNGQYKPSKTKSTVTIHGQEENGIIIFNLNSNKVNSFTVSIFEGC